MRTRLCSSIAAVIVAATPTSYAAPQTPAQVAPAPTSTTPPRPNPTGPLYQHTGEQYRVYNFPVTGESIPYRLFVPTTWKPGVRLPMLVTLRAGTSVDNPYRSQNDLVQQAGRRGYLVVTPMGYRPLPQPYYGSRYPIDRPNAAKPAAGWTPQEDERAEQDVLYVIDLVAEEYGIDTSRIYLHGQNPSASGALHLAAKYPERFAGIVVSSGPIVYSAYPFDRLKRIPLLVIHGDQDTVNPIEKSQMLAAAARAAGVDATYATVPGGTHLEAYLTYAAQIFDFLDAHPRRP